MTNELIRQLEECKKQAADVEVFFPCNGNKNYFHTDQITFSEMNYQEAIKYIKKNELELLDVEWELMSEDEYNHTICANCDSFDFADVYGDSEAKVLCILLPRCS